VLRVLSRHLYACYNAGHLGIAVTCRRCSPSDHNNRSVQTKPSVNPLWIRDRVLRSLVLSALTAVLAPAVASEDFARTSETSLRRMANHTVLPKYPSEAVRLHQTGVVVADVYLYETHTLYRVDVLQAPSLAIAKAVEEALSKWRFAPPASGDARMKIAGKVTFYFLFHRGRYRVFHAQDAPQLRASGRGSRE
jgi:outer membrane biosynthesis protein TonB